MKANIKTLQTFRSELYSLFPQRKDAIFNLLDALTSTAHKAKSVVQLSNAPCFKRKYSSITDAIADGLPHADWEQIFKLAFQATVTDKKPNVHPFVVDCTPNARPFANTLADRSITHAPNPAPGNKPICVGHQYSLVTLLSNDLEAAKKHWLRPVSFRRVQSTQKGNEVGMAQINETIKTLGLAEDLTLSIGDSLYGTKSCRMSLINQPNRLHLFRFNSTRNVFAPPIDPDKNARGRKQEFGKKMQLNDPSTHLPFDDETSTTYTTARGKVHTVHIQCWHNYLLRGGRDFRSSLQPIHVIKITEKDEEGELVYQRPLWLGLIGDRKNELSLVSCYEYYKNRYDIEHFFRFGKRHLLLDAYQTPDVTHESAWWNLCALAYVQLYLSRDLVGLFPAPWERYLAAYKSVSEGKRTLTPSQTQRGFSRLLEEIGTPASACVARGKPQGRRAGEVMPARKKQPVVFKGSKKGENRKTPNVKGNEKGAHSSALSTMEELVESLHAELTRLGRTTEEFIKLFNNSG